MNQETRETVLFLAGLTAFFYLVWGSTTQGWEIDMAIWILIAGMMGVPAVMPMDRRRNSETLRPPISSDDVLPAGSDDGGDAGTTL